jgi:L-lactate dehydrogenase
MQPRKLAIVGAGGVGATIAYACMIRGIAEHIVLYDTDAKKVNAQTLDLSHGMLFTPPARIEGADDIQICQGADIVIITAGARQKPGMTRMDLAVQNSGMLKSVMPPLVAAAPAAIYLMVTNPVDVITYIALKLSGLSRQRVFGSGTVLDSSRFRFLIAQRLKVAVHNVHAYIAGEHGDSEIPLWSSAAIANIPLHEWAVPHHGKLSVRDRVEIFENVKDAAYQVVAGKGATNFAIALATAQILQAVVGDENRVLSVSSLMENYRGISDVCLSVPCIIDAAGVDTTLPIPMNANEEAGLRHSAETIRAAIRSLGF